MINLTRDETKIILSSFYLWKNTDFSDLDRRLVNKMRSGIKKVENKLFSSFSEFTEDDIDVIRHTLSEFVLFLEDPEPEYNQKEILENKSFYLDLIHSVASKLSFSLDL
jgi:hypothetical protein